MCEGTTTLASASRFLGRLADTDLPFFVVLSARAYATLDVGFMQPVGHDHGGKNAQEQWACNEAEHYPALAFEVLADARHEFRLPNVRHERRAKGREAAFGTSARWRG